MFPSNKDMELVATICTRTFLATKKINGNEFSVFLYKKKNTLVKKDF